MSWLLLYFQGTLLFIKIGYQDFIDIITSIDIDNNIYRDYNLTQIITYSKIFYKGNLLSK